ncbi:oxidoreductase, aldo/keto reductase family protein, partial [Streptomyces turgidiscabies Car8]
MSTTCARPRAASGGRPSHLEVEAAVFQCPDVYEHHVRIGERIVEGRIEAGRGVGRNLQKAATRDMAPGVIAAHGTQRAPPSEGIVLAGGEPAAAVGVDEDGALFVVRARIRTAVGGPATQRGVRDKGDPLAERDGAQTAAQRRARVRAGREVGGAGTTGVVGDSQLVEGGCADGEHGVSGHVRMLDRRTGGRWQESDIRLERTRSEGQLERHPRESRTRPCPFPHRPAAQDAPCLERARRRWLAGMKYTQLGRTGLKVSRLVLGTMNFGPQTDEADSHAIMDAALDTGINFFDTANVYGWGENKGRTESIIGNWFAKGGERRDKVVLATKVYGNMAADGEAWPNHDKLSALNIRRAVDASLKRLQTDHIDVYQFHHIDRSTPFEEIWQAVDVLVQQGKILYAGSSNFPGYKIAQANETAARRGGTIGLVSEQCLYNLAERRAEMEVIPAAQEYGLGVIPWSPLHGGLLGGVIRKEVQGGRRASGRAADTLADPASRAQIQAYEDLLDKHGIEPGEAALAWLLTRPGVTGPIVGPRTAEQLESAVRASELELSDELLTSLDEI